VDETIDRAIDGARDFLRSAAGKEEIRRRVDRALYEKQRRMDRARRAWNGVGKRPKAMRGYQQVATSRTLVYS
jgi:hypothetical protein